MNNIYLVQHCQSEHHVNELTGGWTDTPLTTLGKQQAKAVSNELKQLGLTDFILISSDLQRATMTAEYISQEFDKEIILDKNLREINNGVAAGKTKTWANNNKLFQSDELVLDKPTWLNAETPKELFSRMKVFISKNLLNTTKDIVVVGHGVALGNLVCAWLQIEDENMSNVFMKGNAGGISRLSIGPFNQQQVTQFNSTAHLRNL